MCFTPDVPKAPDYGQQTASTLEAQIKYAPDLYNARANNNNGDPAYARLAQSTLNASLFGGNGSPGLADILQRFQASQRQDEVDTVARLGPKAREALRTSNPESAALLDEMNDATLGGLRARGALTPEQTRRVAQQSRIEDTSRGLAYSPNSAFKEVLAQQMGSEAMLDNRLKQAGNTLQFNQGFYGDPGQQILSRPYQSNNALAQAMLGNNQKASGYMLNPESAYAGGLYDTDYNARAAAAIASANNTAAVAGAGLSAL